MARLNEIPAPAESVEALKRRFVRQNREIARVNSLQSLRIQGLESELTHLLKENAALKEQVISLQHDAEKYQAGRAFHKDVSQCKEKLAQKISELNNLVNDLGIMPQTFLKKTAHLETDGENQRASEFTRRPITWNDNEGRLPTILEDKYFPRRTIDPQDFQEEQDPESPSIGSPPVAHFDMRQSRDSPSGHDHITHSEQHDFPSDEEQEEDNDHAESCSPSNLPSDSNRHELPVSDLAVSPSRSPTPVLSGSKRKFGAIEDFVTFSPSPVKKMNKIDDDFQFTRANEVPQNHRPNVVVEIINEAVEETSKPPTKKAPPKRKVLEPKTTNMVSSKKQSKETAKSVDLKPEKPTKHTGNDDPAYKAEITSKICQNRTQNAKRAKKTTTTIIHEDERTATPISHRLELEGPAKIQRMTFAPDEHTATDSNPLPGLGSRPSRRARGAISYAEPNLRDKMRRATNELVDAVNIGGQRRSSTVAGTSTCESSASSLKLNNFHEEHDLSIDDNARPTIAIEGLPELPKHLVTERKRRTLSASTNDLEQWEGSGSGADLRSTIQFDDASSTLPLTDKEDITAHQTMHTQSRRRSTNPVQSRRHSSNPTLPDRGKSSSNDDALESESETHDDSWEESQSVTEDRSASQARAKRTLMEDNMSLQDTRGQRATARRRSMMV